jgi:hypothetical protein
MPETRTKLKHLLEDIRDNYPFPVGRGDHHGTGRQLAGLGLLPH